MKKHLLKCPRCGTTIGQAEVSLFEQSIRKDMQMELEKRTADLQKQKSELKRLTRQFETEKLKLEQQASMKVTEREKLISELKKKLDDARKRADTAFTSQQLAGEVQELALESILTSTFPSDKIIEVKKGQIGADCIQHVIVNGQEIARIAYESKRTKVFSNSWLSKLKENGLQSKADLLVLVTETMPKDVKTKFAIVDNVWICNLQDVRELAMVLRYGLVKIKDIAGVKQNKESSMSRMFDFLTSQEFKNIFESIVEDFKTLQETHLSEKLKVQRLWKEREQLLEKILTQSISLYGSLKGIAGVAMPKVQILEALPEGR